MKERDMSKFVIETAIRENYAAHDSDWDGVSEYWKNKGGNTYIVEAETAEEAKTVIPLVTDSSNAFEENFEDFFECFDTQGKICTQWEGNVFTIDDWFVPWVFL